MIIDYHNQFFAAIYSPPKGFKAWLNENLEALPAGFFMTKLYKHRGAGACRISAYCVVNGITLIPWGFAPLIIGTFKPEFSQAFMSYAWTRQVATQGRVVHALGGKTGMMNYNSIIMELHSLGQEPASMALSGADNSRRHLQAFAIGAGVFRQIFTSVMQGDPYPNILYSLEPDYSGFVVANRDKISNILPGLTLRDFQTEAVIAFLTYTVGGMTWPHGIIQAPARSGKTEIICALVKLLGCEATIITDRRQLIRQIKARMESREFGDVGYVDGSSDKVRPITCATIQSSRTNLLLNSRFTTVIDEAHIASSEGFVGNWEDKNYTGAICDSLSPVRIGTTATPFGFDQLENLKVMAGCGPVIYQISRRILEEKGIVAKSKVYMLTVNHDHCKKTYKLLDTKPHSLYLYNFAYNTTRNQMLAAAVKSCGVGRKLMLVKNLKHALELAKEFQNPYIVFGSETETDEKTGVVRTVNSMSVEERERVLSQFLSQEDAVMIATSVVYVGIDFPGGCVAVANCAAGVQFESVIQRICRGLNPNENNQVVRLFDTFDTGEGKEGAKLRDKAKIRQKAYGLAEFDVEVVG